MTTVSEYPFSSEELEIVKNTLAELDVSMNADIKQRWVEALRSGQYKQGSGGLRTNNAYCCLGVLCELHRQDFLGKEWQQKNQHGGQFSYILSDAVDYPPEEVSDWAGLILSDAVDYPPEEVSDWASLGPSVYDLLADANDSGADFPTIASLIEEML